MSESSWELLGAMRKNACYSWQTETVTPETKELTPKCKENSLHMVASYERNTCCGYICPKCYCIIFGVHLMVHICFNSTSLHVKKNPIVFPLLELRTAIATVLRGNFEEGWLCHFGLKCSSFTTVNVGISNRSPCSGFGNTSYRSVREANLLASRILGLTKSADYE